MKSFRKFFIESSKPQKQLRQKFHKVLRDHHFSSDMRAYYGTEFNSHNFLAPENFSKLATHKLLVDNGYMPVSDVRYDNHVTDSQAFIIRKVGAGDDPGAPIHAITVEHHHHGMPIDESVGSGKDGLVEATGRDALLRALHADLKELGYKASSNVWHPGYPGRGERSSKARRIRTFKPLKPQSSEDVRAVFEKHGYVQEVPLQYHNSVTNSTAVLFRGQEHGHIGDIILHHYHEGPLVEAGNGKDGLIEDFHHAINDAGFVQHWGGQGEDASEYVFRHPDMTIGQGKEFLKSHGFSVPSGYQSRYFHNPVTESTAELEQTQFIRKNDNDRLHKLVVKHYHDPEVFRYFTTDR